MMLIATSVAAALFASIAFTAAPAAAAAALPPMTVDVTMAATVSPSLAALVLAQADAIWRAAGVTFSWRRAPRALPDALVSAVRPYMPDTLRVIIGDQRGGAGSGGRVPLGWIVFDGVAMPEQEIYLSHANALAVLGDARGVVGEVASMPLAQRDTLLGRAMGRALAHELGHYLLKSKSHTRDGLMKAMLTAVELFMPDARALRIEPTQQSAVAVRLNRAPLVASR